MALTTATIPGMTVTENTGTCDLTIEYRDRTFRVILGEPAHAGEYDAMWGYSITETTDDLAMWDGSDSDYDSATTALQAAQVAIRQTVDDDADNQR